MIKGNLFTDFGRFSPFSRTSDGLEGCEHAVFEILSNAIDEAREGYGREIILTRFRDGRIQVEDLVRGCPRGLEREGAEVQLGVGVLRALRRWQV